MISKIMYSKHTSMGLIENILKRYLLATVREREKKAEINI